jgi:hypothetical protein
VSKVFLRTARRSGARQSACAPNTRHGEIVLGLAGLEPKARGKGLARRVTGTEPRAEREKAPVSPTWALIGDYREYFSGTTM